MGILQVFRSPASASTLRLLLAATLVLSLASPAFADESTTSAGDGDPATADTVYVVPEIVVEAPRVPLAAGDVFRQPGFVAVVELNDRHDRVEDLSGVLSQMVGVRVRQYGGLGSFATASIRGSSANQVDVFLDGIPLGDAYTGVTNLGDLPLDGLDHIEVFRGYAPPHLGSSAIGGAVNLATPNPRQSATGRGAQVHGRVSQGSFGTGRYVGSLSASSTRVGLFANLSYMESAGNFRFVDDRSTPENLADDRDATRTNNDFQVANLIGRVQIDVPAFGDLSLSHVAVLREQGVPGLGANQSETARSKRNAYTSYVRLSPRPLVGEALSLVGTGFHSLSNERFHDPDGDISLTEQDTDNMFTSYGASMRMKLDVPGLPVVLDCFFEGRRERFHPEATLPRPTSGPDGHRASVTSVLSGDIFLHRLNVVLTASQRFQRHKSELYDPPRLVGMPPTPQGEITQSDRSPHLGFRWLAAPGVTVKGNWGRYFRIPTLLELYGNTGSITGNAALEPERGVGRDIGVVLSGGDLGPLRNIFAELAYLDNDIDNLILYFPNSQRTSRAENISSARIRGVESSLSMSLGKNLRLAGNYTRLHSTDTGPVTYYQGNALPGRPRDDLAVFTDLLNGRWKISYEYHFLGENFLDPANLRVADARQIHNLAVEARMVSDTLVLTIGGRNLADDRVSDVSGFPLPGRSVYATLSLKI